MFLLWKYFALGFSALLPLINPLGSALIFLGLVGHAPIDAYRALARKIAINTVIFFAVIELVGSSVLGFFGISHPRRTRLHRRHAHARRPRQPSNRQPDHHRALRSIPRRHRAQRRRLFLLR